jgi:hypothetical protein
MGEALTPRFDDGRTIGFSNNPMADLSDFPFVLKAAARFEKRAPRAPFSMQWLTS